MSLIRKKGERYIIDCYNISDREKIFLTLRVDNSKFIMSTFKFKNFNRDVKIVDKIELSNNICNNFKIVISKYGTPLLAFEKIPGKFNIINLFERKGCGIHPNDFLSYDTVNNLDIYEVAPKDFKCKLPQ